MKRAFIILALLLLLLPGAMQATEVPESQTPPKPDGQTTISLAEDMGEAMRREASRVGDEFQKQALSLFERRPLGWDKTTLVRLYQSALSLPLRLPQLARHILSQGRSLGVVGSLLVLTFLVAVFYTFIGQKRVMARVERAAKPLQRIMPDEAYPYFLSILRIVVASLIPLVLLGAYSLINAFIHYKAIWFLLVGRLFGVWSIGALALNLLHESLTSGLYPAADKYGSILYRRARLVVLYILGGTAVVWGAEAFTLSTDALAFLKFAVSLSVVCVLLLLFFNKRAILSLLPELPYQNYRTFRNNFERYYLPVVYSTFFTGVIWCFGYKRFSEVIWTKTWAVAGVYVGFLALFHLAQGKLTKLSGKQKIADNEDARRFYRSLRKLLLYASVTGSALIILNLLGLLDPIVRLFSFPILRVGESQLTLWLFIQAILVFVVFSFLSVLLRSYLSFKVYPSIGVDTGLAYALNTFLKYIIFFIAFLATLRAVGLNPRVLMIFAGAAGIGIGLGLQNMAANLISGLTIIFGQRIRQGDWVQVGDTMGVITDIYLHSTKVLTRDNVEFLIPNSQFLSNTIINYTLSTPTIRLSVPVGVSYEADPVKVQDIFLAAAGKHPELTKHKAPEVRFVGYGESSIDFEVLVWIDIRKIARRKARSELYFTIFEMLKTEGIQIPYPQRDLHIRSGLEDNSLRRAPV
jgi:potassium efflux system protein